MRSRLHNLNLFDRRQFLAVLVVALIFCATLTSIWMAGKDAKAATLGTINFQARLMNDSGGIVPDGFYNVEFKLYDVSSGGSALWTETYYDSNGVTAGNDNRTRVANGYITVNLGALTSFPSTINWDQEIWLTMNVGDSDQTATPTWDGEMSPRLRLTAVPYAFRAGQLAQFNSGNGFTSTLSIVQPTGGDQIFQIPDQGTGGTFSLLTTTAANAAYIQLQSSTPGTPQTGHFNISGTGIAGTALQAPLLQTADGTGASTAITLRSGNSTTSGNTGGVTIASGNATSGNSGNISIDVGTASGTAGTVSIGTGQASAVTIGRTGVTTTNSGALTVTQGLTANGGIGVAGNQNLTLSNGTGVFSQTFSNGAASSAQTLSVTNSNSGGSSVAVNGQQITLVGTATSGGTNSNTAISFANPSAAANNNFYGLNFAGTGYTDILRVGGTQIINGAGIIQSAGISGSYTGITGVGTLTAGALGAGFTTVAVGQGGTGATSLTQYGVLYGNGTGAIQALTPGASGECLVGNTGAAPSWSSCNTNVSLQDAYDASTSPEIVLDSTNGALTVRDASSPIAGNLLEVQDNGGTTTYLGVNTSGITVSGNVDAGTGTIIGSFFRSTDQTAGSTNSAATTFRSGSVAGATSNSGGVTVQSGNSTTSGNTGNVSIVSGNATSGNSGNISIDVGTASGTLGQISLGTTTATTVNIGAVGSTNKASTIHIADTTDATAAQAVTIGSSASNANNITIVQGGSNTTQSIQLLPNTAGGIMIGAAAGTGRITLGQSTATNDIYIGSADLTSGTPTQNINIGNGSFSTGATVAVNILSGGAGSSGTATLSLGNNDRVTQIDIGNVAADAARTLNFGTGGNTVAVDTINIGTGNTTVAGGKTIHIGDGTPSGSGTNLITIGTSATAGSTVTLQGVIKLSNPGASTANAVALCRDSSTTNLIACDSGAGGTPFIQGGNSFGAAGVLGTNDANNLQFETANVVRATFDQSNGLFLGEGVTDGTPTDFTVSATGSSAAGVAGAVLTLQGGAGASATTGSAGGNIVVAGGNAGGSGNNAGGNVVLQGGLDTNTGTPGKVLVKNSADSTTAFQVQNAAGTSTVLDVDTTNGYVGVGTAAPTRPLHVAVNNSTVNGQALKIEQSGSGDVGIEFSEPGQTFYAGVDATDHKFKISSSMVGSTSVNMGFTSIGSSGQDTSSNNTYNATRFTANGTGVINTVYAYVGATVGANPNNKGQVAIYSDSSGTPGSRLGMSTGDTTLNPSSWNAFPVTATNVTNGVDYWLVYNTNGTSSNQNGLHYQAGAVNQIRFYFNNPGSNYGTWAASWPGTTSSSPNQYSIYAPIVTSTASDNFLGSLFQMGATGETIFQNSANSTTAFQIQNAAASSTVLGVDTTNGRVGINTAAPTADLSFGAGANRVINVLAQPTAATAGNNLTINSGQGNTSGTGGTLSLQAGQGGTTGAGGQTVVQGGSGGSTSGAGGLVTIQGGNATAGNSGGGGVSILGGTATGTGTASVITITAGAGVSGQNTAGGNVNITSGAGGGNQTGGTIALQAGTGGATGVGGAITITGGTGGGATLGGGNVTVAAGLGNTTGTGGNLSLQGGRGGATGTGGTATLIGGQGGTTSGAGGAVTVSGGTALGAFAGGNVTIQGGVAAATAGSNGGAVTVRGTAGTSTGTGGSGGSLTLQGGNAGGSGNNTGGSISLQSGSSTGTGAASTVSITSGAGASGNNVQGGGITITTGAGGGTQAGGTLALQAGTGGATGNGGAVTITGGTAGGATLIGGAITVRAGTGNTSGIGGALNLQGGTGGNAASGGVVAIQGGNAGGGNTNGANVTIAGGTATGTGAQGLVVINTPTMNTTTTDANCGATTAVSCTIATATVNNTSSVLVGATAASVTVDMPNPTIVTAGRIFYFTAFNSTSDFTLRLNNGDPGVISIAMRNNSTATLIWNGSDWTAAGASSSTDLQSAYNNTLASAGAAELVLNAPGGNADGLTIRNNATTPITGGLLEVQNSIGSNLFSVNNNATEYATNGGAETAGASSSTFPSNTWDTTTGGTVDRWTTAGSNIATGQASVRVQTTTTNHGARNRISATLTSGLSYTVSFAVRGSANFSTLDVRYSPDGTTTGTTQCATAQTVTSGIWTRITCGFAASGSINSSNSILIRQTDATGRTFYLDNLSVTINASATYAADGSVDDVGGFATHWSNYAASGTSTVARETTTIYDTSGSARATVSATAGIGLRNNLAVFPQQDTQYLVSFYMRSTTAMSGTVRVGFLPAGGTGAPSGAAACTDYSTQTLVADTWTEITCLFSTDGTSISNPDLVIYQSDAASRVIYVDALSITLNSNNSNNVQGGGANKGGPVTLFTLDRSNGTPIAANNEAYLGSMYYDTESGRIQCYEADGWGACGAAPDNIVNLNPEYAGAVLNGTGIGTMTADFCADETSITFEVNDTLCDEGEARNYYRWTSPQATQQTYSIYVTYQLPATFNGFSSDDTVQLMARVDSTTNAEVTFEMFKSTGSAISRCGTETDVIAGAGDVANEWRAFGVNGNEATGCSFNSSSAGNFVIFKINMKALSNANAYVSTLSFTTTGR